MKGIKKLANDESGVIMIIAALSLSVFLVFTSFAIDMGLLYNKKTRLQTALDSAAIAAAYELPDREKAEAAAKAYMKKNNRTMKSGRKEFDLTNLVIEFPGDGNDYVRVRLDMEMDTIFGTVADVGSYHSNQLAAATVTAVDAPTTVTFPYLLFSDDRDTNVILGGSFGIFGSIHTNGGIQMSPGGKPYWMESPFGDYKSFVTGTVYGVSDNPNDYGGANYLWQNGHNTGPYYYNVWSCNVGGEVKIGQEHIDMPDYNDAIMESTPTFIPEADTASNSYSNDYLDAVMDVYPYFTGYWQSIFNSNPGSSTTTYATATNMTGTLYVPGNCIFNQPAVINGSLIVNGSLTTANNCTLTVHGDVYVNGNCNINRTTYIDGDLVVADYPLKYYNNADGNDGNDGYDLKNEDTPYKLTLEGGRQLSVGGRIYVAGDVDLSGNSFKVGINLSKDSSTNIVRNTATMEIIHTDGVIYCNGNFKTNGSCASTYCSSNFNGNIYSLKSIYLATSPKEIYGGLYSLGDVTVYGVANLYNGDIYSGGNVTFEGNMPSVSMHKGSIYAGGKFKTGQGFQISEGMLVAEGDVEVYGMAPTLNSSETGAVAIYSRHGDVKLAPGNGMEMYGMIYAPEGDIAINSGTIRFHGSLIGHTIKKLQPGGLYLGENTEHPLNFTQNDSVQRVVLVE